VTRADDVRWREAGDRIATLLDASASGGALARERAEQLVREVVELYGAGLQRITSLVDPELLAKDDLVASLLLVHGLHPHSVERRVSDALDTVRPYLGSHGGDVSLIEVDGDVVRLELRGSCKTCPSSSVTLELAVEDAVRAAAPEIVSIEVVAAEPESSVIGTDSLFEHIRHEHRDHSWHPVPEVAALGPGEIGGFAVDETVFLACRVGPELFAYRDHCPVCDGSLAGSTLDGGMLTCTCGAGFDVVHAGAGFTAEHLDPLPLLERDGVLSLAGVAG
jgi:Fe-S cluster biogenesis protein NfuA/nitrite reductase/ring-hydroxylating ferredoxin subunit